MSYSSIYDCFFAAFSLPLRKARVYKQWSSAEVVGSVSDTSGGGGASCGHDDLRQVSAGGHCSCMTIRLIYRYRNYLEYNCSLYINEVVQYPTIIDLRL